MGHRVIVKQDSESQFCPRLASSGGCGGAESWAASRLLQGHPHAVASRGAPALTPLRLPAAKRSVLRQQLRPCRDKAAKPGQDSSRSGSDRISDSNAWLCLSADSGACVLACVLDG